MKLAYFLKDMCASGGMERVLSNKCTWLCARGYEVHVVSLRGNSHEKPFFPFPETVQRHSLKLDLLSQRRHRPHLGRSQTATTFIAAADDWLHRIQPDIAVSLFDDYSRYLCHTRYPCAKVGELHFAKHKRAQYLYRAETFPFLRGLINRYKHRNYQLIASYDRFVTLTTEDQAAWGNLPNITTIPNAQTFPSADRATLQGKRVIALGRHTRQKQFDHLIRAWAPLARSHPDSRLTVMGPGDKRDLRALAEHLGVSAQVDLRDATAGIRRALLDSDVLAMPSHYEGFGMVLLEAMTCGVPVVAYACHSGPRDIITHGEDGFLVPPGDISGLRDRLNQLLTDAPLRHRMGTAAYLKAQCFSPDTVMAHWEALFRALISRKSATAA